MRQTEPRRKWLLQKQLSLPARLKRSAKQLNHKQNQPGGKEHHLALNLRRKWGTTNALRSLQNVSSLYKSCSDFTRQLHRGHHSRAMLE